MPVYFAPEIPHSVLSEAISTLGSELSVDEDLVLVVKISTTEWFVATQSHIHFTGKHRASRHVIRDVTVKRESGIQFFVRDYSHTIPHSAFERSGDTQEAWRRLRKAYIAYEKVPTQRISKAAALMLLSYEPESHSYWLRTRLEDGEVGDETEWCADYRFTESRVFKDLGLNEVKVEGELSLIEQFRSEPNMNADISPKCLKQNAQSRLLALLTLRRRTNDR